MSNPASAQADQKRPPGPHNQNIKLVTRTSTSASTQDHAEKPPRQSINNSPNTTTSSQDTNHQRLVLTDPIAFRYLEEDPGVTVVTRRQELQGYEIYIVEQWATSRTHPTFVITTYTGDPQHVAQVGVLSVPIDEAGWSQRLRVYFKALNQYHARRKDTALGILMITNLSGFPSSLTVIPVPDGDLRKHRFDFFVNENLKRMGCSGRVGLNLSQPAGATVAKFHQLYKTSDKNSLYMSVIELVKLCQAALNLFDKLEIDYADGLLCDVTEKAVNDWWLDIGAEFFNIEPHDGILGPTTVSALLGLFMGARNRLNAVNAPVPKDPFDVEGMKRGISQFQKSHRLERNRRLDRHTLDKLHKNSAKAANAEGWSMPRAVKSTVAELSGKGGEMLAEVVGRRDKAGIADIETPYIDRFEQLVYGHRCKWLWLGKPLKNASIDLNDSTAAESRLEFKSDEHGGFTWAGRKQNPELVPPDRVDSEEMPSPQLPSSREGEDSSRDDHPHRSVTKRATGLFNDGRRGFGKFKDAVRIHPKGSKDDTPMSPIDSAENGFQRPVAPKRSHIPPPGSPTSPKATDSSLDSALQEPKSQTDSSISGPKFTNHLLASPLESSTCMLPLEDPQSRKSEEQTVDESSSTDKQEDGAELERLISRSSAISAEPSIAGSVYRGVDLDDVLPEPKTLAQDVDTLLRRTSSWSDFENRNSKAKIRSNDYYPRHLSFSIAEDSTSVRAGDLTTAIPEKSTRLEAQFEYETMLSSDLMALRAAVASVDRKEGNWTRKQLISVRELLSRADQDQQYLEQLYYPASTTLQDIRDASEGLLRDERESLLEGSKELETLAARLDYEISGLKGKIEDVEVGVDDFERAVAGVEDRIGELEDTGDASRCVVS